MSQYDERLLASAPVATRAEKQEGYNVDLLEGPRNTTSGKNSPPPVPPTVPLASNVDHAENGMRKQESYAKYADDTPWYKTKKGLIGIVIVVIVVIAAVVGGAVGGTVGKSNNNDNNNATASSTGGSNGPTSAAPEGNQGGAPTSPAASSTGNPGASVGAGAPPIALPTLI
ncbi:hypothetical protein NLI96_g8630 [Meripilus lineatus]|uniref:Uncharacterized protein n=1 Tax=Meripilus lineatus TaxID=2056292 RepID=A0AAD5V261_9APHY|nr:hypothetical protein NLI96_g8630 [Physisporinus lineatus]